MIKYLNIAIWPFDKIGEAIVTFFYWVLLMLNSIIYSFISFIYQIFLVLCQGDGLLEDTIINKFIDRIYIILGVVVLFLVAYSLLRSMINPDEELKGKKSPVTMVKNVIISIVLVALVPTIFDFAFDVQNSILRYNTIGKIIAGDASDNSTYENSIQNGGANIAASVWQAFLYPKEGYCQNRIQELDPDKTCKELKVNNKTYGELWEDSKNNKTFWDIANLASPIEDGDVTYLFLFDAVAGAFVLLVLVSYCLDMAVRLVKLSVFELIAPLPIFARIIPNEQVNKVFDNWLKATISTFVEVFIRIAILFFAVIVISTVADSFYKGNFITSSFDGSASFMVSMLAQALIIVGIILFVKQAPGIIKDITGLDGSKYNVLGGAMKAAAMLGAGVTGTVRGFNTSPFDKEHKITSGFNKFRNALAGGAKSFYGAQGKDYKSLKDMKANASSSVEDVINKQRQRQADKDAKARDLKSYRDRQKQANPNIDEDSLIYKAKSRITHDAKDKWNDIKTWAGASGEDPITDARTKEAINAIGSLVGAMQDSWKKDPGFVKAKEEANKAEALHNAVQDFIRQGHSEADVVAQFGMGSAEAKRQFEMAKAVKDSQEKTLQTSKSKINQIAGKALEIQRTMEKYGDINAVSRSNINKMLTEAESDPTKLARLQASAEKWSDLSDETTYKNFVSALGSGDQSAIDYLDVLDKLDIAGKQELTQISAREIDRSSTSKKKEDK